jgi:hypothetical protein
VARAFFSSPYFCYSNVSAGIGQKKNQETFLSAPWAKSLRGMGKGLMGIYFIFLLFFILACLFFILYTSPLIGSTKGRQQPRKSFFMKSVYSFVVFVFLLAAQPALAQSKNPDSPKETKSTQQTYKVNEVLKAAEDFFGAGVGINYNQSGETILAPVRLGVGWRLGVGIGYLHFTKDKKIWPF